MANSLCKVEDDSRFLPGRIAICHRDGSRLSHKRVWFVPNMGPKCSYVLVAFVLLQDYLPVTMPGFLLKWIIQGTFLQHAFTKNYLKCEGISTTPLLSTSSYKSKHGWFVSRFTDHVWVEKWLLLELILQTLIFVCVYIYIPYIYIHTYMPLTPLSGPFFRPEDVKEERERRKTKADKGKDKKEEETLKHETLPPFRWVCFMAIFDYITGDFYNFNQNLPTQRG